MTSELAEAIMEHLVPLGVGVVVTGQHTCMAMRGIESAGELLTSALLGVFRSDPTIRAEFLGMVNGRSV